MSYLEKGRWKNQSNNFAKNNQRHFQNVVNLANFGCNKVILLTKCHSLQSSHDFIFGR